MRADDALKYAAARLRSGTDWARDSIGGSLCDAADGHEDELLAIAEAMAEIDRLAAEFGDRSVYSDGRLVKSAEHIDGGAIRIEHVWHPDPSQEKSESWRGTLLHDPGTPCPGIYEVTTYPETQNIHVRVIRPA